MCSGPSGNRFAAALEAVPEDPVIPDLSYSVCGQ